MKTKRSLECDDINSGSAVAHGVRAVEGEQGGDTRNKRRQGERKVRRGRMTQ